MSTVNMLGRVGINHHQPHRRLLGLTHRPLTLTHMITAYSVSGNVVRVRTLICVFLYGFFPVINGLSTFEPRAVAFTHFSRALQVNQSPTCASSSVSLPCGSHAQFTTNLSTAVTFSHGDKTQTYFTQKKIKMSHSH